MNVSDRMNIQHSFGYVLLAHAASRYMGKSSTLQLTQTRHFRRRTAEDRRYEGY